MIDRTVLAIECGDDWMGEGEPLGTASTIEEALALVRDHGWTVIEEGNGGSYDEYGADDAARIFGLRSGRGVFCITVEPA